MSRPSALRGSAPRSDLTPVPVPKSYRPKTPMLLAGTKPSYPPMLPKWDEVSDLKKAYKVCYSCFRAHTRVQRFVTLVHVGLIISNNPEVDQSIIDAYTEKKKTWEEAKKNTPPHPKPRGQCTNFSDMYPSPPIPAKDPPRATARSNYWDSL